MKLFGCKATYKGINLSGSNPICYRPKHHDGAHEAELVETLVTWYVDPDGAIHSSMKPIESEN